MIIIDIDSVTVKTKSGNKNGKDWKMTFQQCAYTGHYTDGFPARNPQDSSIQLEDGDQPYPVGRYALASDSFFFGDFGRFMLGRVKLVPLKDHLAELQRQLGVTIAYNQPKAA